jgi:hypothetical protein
MKNVYFVIFLITVTGCSGADDDYLSENENPKLTITKHEERFDTFPFSQAPKWRSDIAEYQVPYSESGEYFEAQGIIAPDAYRSTFDIGTGDWLVAELYTRTKDPLILDYIDVVPDPENRKNTVLKISTPHHTDGAIIRSKNPLPPKYRISLRVGYANYGDDTELNGHDSGNEQAEPWLNRSSTVFNGFYWLAILDSQPKPHNNIWIHHHRKFVIDSWNRKNFNNVINVIALDGKSVTDPRLGKGFISNHHGGWQKNNLEPVDYFLANEWYTVTVTRTESHYEYKIEGEFRNAGQTIYSDRINFRKNCIFHYNQTPQEMTPDCVDIMQDKFFNKIWPADSAYPEYFMFGEPHINYYEGDVLVDDITFEVL